MPSSVDQLTKRWVRNQSDEVAIDCGARFNLEAASFFIWWVERHCRLYEGEQSGQPLIMMSHVSQKRGNGEGPMWPIPAVFDWKDPDCRQIFEDRCEWHLGLLESGEHMDWQYECHMRLYGWQMYSEHFERMIRRFKEGCIFTGKKNKKSPTMAANALYLTCADGEPGAKTFMMAKTGKQVRENVGQHIFEMWQRSPTIKAESKFNKNEMRLYHLPTSSIVRSLASDNKEVRESNEGINGNVVIDEIHVVDRETVEIVDRAGISRSESLHLEFSTSGKDNSGYGRERFDYGLAIQQSDEVNVSFFSAIYAADQETKPEDLANRDTLIRHGKKANPAWGHTIDPTEFEADYQKSKVTPHRLAQFMMYRTNIWRQEGTPYIIYADWKRCGKDFEFKDFAGMDCQCSLDMAVSKDLVAFTWAFEGDGKAWYWTDHWLPKATAIEMQERVPYLDWERQGWIRLLPGKVIDEDLVFEDIQARNELVNVKCIHYDPNRSKYLTRKLEEAGYELELFRQNNREYHPHVERFERLIIGHEREDGERGEPMMHHPNNPVLNWQIKHCQIDEDRYSYKRPIKPPTGDHRKVDGVQSCVMATKGLTEHLGGLHENAYSDPQAPWLRTI